MRWRTKNQYTDKDRPAYGSMGNMLVLIKICVFRYTWLQQCNGVRTPESHFGARGSMSTFFLSSEILIFMVPQIMKLSICVYIDVQYICAKFHKQTCLYVRCKINKSKQSFFGPECFLFCVTLILPMFFFFLRITDLTNVSQGSLYHESRQGPGGQLDIQKKKDIHINLNPDRYCTSSLHKSQCNLNLQHICCAQNKDHAQSN